MNRCNHTVILPMVLTWPFDQVSRCPTPLKEASAIDAERHGEEQEQSNSCCGSGDSDLNRGPPGYEPGELT